MARSITTRSTNPKIMDDNIKILDDALAAASTPPAEDVSYDNTNSGLTADDVQGAIDEIANLKSISVVKTTDINGIINFSDLGLPSGVNMNNIYSLTVVDGISYAWAILNNPSYIKIVAINNTSVASDTIQHIGERTVRLNIIYKS